MDITPNKSSLLMIEKGNRKIVEEYAQRQREKTAHVNPFVIGKK